MPAIFERGGLRFQYPESWSLEESPTPNGWTVSVQSPETAFMLLNLYRDRPDVDEVLDIALAALKQEYPDLESDVAEERIARHQAHGHDIQFFSMDLTNSCWLRSFRTAHATILILCQTNDLELDRVEPVFRAMRKSIELTEP